MSPDMTSARLRPIQQIAEKKEQDAAARVRERQQLLTQRRARLQELMDYLAEYDAPGQTLTVTMLINRQAFIDKLRQAIDMQTRLVEQAQQMLEAERDKWLGQRREVKTLEQLALQYQQRERAEEERRAQKQLDEFALRQYAHPADREAAL
ncbi:flagellar export protein FliJ [Sinimarinibacterium sp. NLF-5-8]|uniref:flagellar export protein FliJ n=1 Tax=Sinimarinibacterium sp. NLF-5-8 TaxID=2698684 RepID=UPI00137BC056|nr:flagellar export protein FliJ [Sinimarinibacterium sp. NLF-5-8]QHS09244.1 flagellar export protein FliJ [Sinimarinibacterium sp. NLF-5-8]